MEIDRQKLIAALPFWRRWLVRLHLIKPPEIDVKIGANIDGLLAGFIDARQSIKNLLLARQANELIFELQQSAEISKHGRKFFESRRKNKMRRMSDRRKSSYP